MTQHMDIEDYIKIKKKLSKYKDLSNEELEKILQPLENCQITKQILKQSLIHQVISKLAKNKLNLVDSTIQKKAQKIKQKWKNVLQGKPNQLDQDDKEEEQNEKLEENKSQVMFENKLREKFFQGFKKKFQQNLQNSEPDKVLQICLEIEKLIYSKAKENDDQYSKLARERFQIICAKDNNNIVQNIYDGSLNVFDFIDSDAKTLLSNKKLEQIMQEGKNYTMQALQTDFYLKNSDVKEGEFQCFRCKGKKIMTTQKQMRSADEPMTTFFHCVQCNNRWKN